MAEPLWLLVSGWGLDEGGRFMRNVQVGNPLAEIDKCRVFPSSLPDLISLALGHCHWPSIRA